MCISLRAHGGQQILISCGAVNYCFDQLMARSAEGQALISEAGLPNPEPLLWLLDDLMEPVKAVFETLGRAPEPAFAAQT